MDRPLILEVINCLQLPRVDNITFVGPGKILGMAGEDRGRADTAQRAADYYRTFTRRVAARSMIRSRNRRGLRRFVTVHVLHSRWRCSSAPQP